MKLLEQLLRETGADTGKAITLIPSYGCYLQSVKRVEEYTPEKIIISIGKLRVTLTGQSLTIDKYFIQDLFIKGNVTGVNIE